MSDKVPPTKIELAVASPNSNTLPTDFGRCCFRLSGIQWGVVLLMLIPLGMGISPLWKKWEGFAPTSDYRVPYEQSDDYWLYQRHLESPLEQASPSPIYLVGDSVIWGEFVLADGTLSHFLTEHEAERDVEERRVFVNAGLNGQFPLALEGLVRYYGQSLRGQKVILHCNLLWMSSPEADLSSTKEQTFNHVALVPQFRYPLACYRATWNDRLGIAVTRSCSLFSWIRHVQFAYFDGENVPAWTLVEEPGRPYENPLGQIIRQGFGKSARNSERDPDRGPQSPRHQSWELRQLHPQSFEWVTSEKSMQWAAFRRLVELLEQRKCKLLVLVGGFNEAMIAPAARSPYEAWKKNVSAWLRDRDVRFVDCPALASELYGDASHPLTSGYRIWADDLWMRPEFQEFLDEQE